MTKVVQVEVGAAACASLVTAVVVGNSVVLAQAGTPRSSPVHEVRRLPEGITAVDIAALDARGESFVVKDGTLYAWTKRQYQRIYNALALAGE